ncbi:hypothetical protein D915_004827 [Fasciola hepatica]|uniref:Uncharacterized protein n=1 Tax=Fasciola hepatica TaxID=6192 RepID=A0A4E0R6U7_FASHE|nr:hypothetical protein D915_004827 [Fasciola hepatica]
MSRFSSIYPSLWRLVPSLRYTHALQWKREQTMQKTASHDNVSQPVSSLSLICVIRTSREFQVNKQEQLTKCFGPSDNLKSIVCPTISLITQPTHLRSTTVTESVEI